MGDFNFRIAPEIILGQDTLNRLPLLIGKYGDRVMIIADPVLYISKIIERVETILENNQIKTLLFDEIPKNPNSTACDEAINLARGSKPHCIIGIGGAKTLAIAKITAMLTNGTVDSDLLIDGALPNGNALPFISIPTALHDPFMFADMVSITDARNRTAKIIKTQPYITKAVIIDPNLSLGISFKTASMITLDLIMESLECYISSKANFYSDSMSEKAFYYLFKALDSFIKNPDDPQGRNFLAHGSFLTSMSAATASLGIGTAISFAINSKFGIPKASLASIFLPYVMDEAAKARVEKIAAIAPLSGAIVDGLSIRDAALAASEAVRSRLGALKIPTRLKDFDLELDRLVEIASIARELDMINHLPAVVSVEDIYDLIKQAY